MQRRVERPRVVFDLDGTLIDSAPEIHRVAQEVLAEHGLAPIDYPQVRGFIGNGVPVLVARILAAQGQPPDGALHAQFCERFLSKYEEAFDLTTLYPNVAAMLEALAAEGFTLAICTNKPEAPTRAVLQHFGLLQHFPVIVGGDTLPLRKPDPEPLLSALRQMPGGDPVFVGDSEVDAQTAARAGVPLALFTEGYRKTAAQDLGAAFLFHDHLALLDYLRR